MRVISTRRAWATGHRVGFMGEINLPTWAWNKLIIAHELAHVIFPPKARAKGDANGSPHKGYAGHGREFAGMYLYLVGKMCGKDVKNRLKEEFLKRNVDWDNGIADS